MINIANEDFYENKNNFFLSLCVLFIVTTTYVYKNIYDLGLWSYKQRSFTYLQENILKIPFAAIVLESESYRKKSKALLQGFRK